MANRNDLNMLSGMGNGVQEPTVNLEDSLQAELQLLLQHQHNQNILGRERDLNMFRSGSAPPTVEGSLNAMGSLFWNSNFGEITGTSSTKEGILSEDEICSHPAYLSYYYSQNKNNPRLPPPLLSREDWRVAQRFQAGGSSNGDIGDWGRKKMVPDNGSDSLSLFSMQPGLSVQRAENDLMELRNKNGRNFSRKASFDMLDRGTDDLIGLPSSGIGSRRKSFADILQEGLDQSGSISRLPPRPSSCNAFGDLVNMSVADSSPTGLCNGLAPVEVLHNGVAPHGMSEDQRHSTRGSSSFQSAGSSLSRSPTPELKIVGKSHNSGLPPVGSRVCRVEKNVLGPNIQNGHSFGKAELADMTSNLSSLRLSKNRHGDVQNYTQSQRHMDLHNMPDLQPNNSHYQNLRQGLVYIDNSENLSFGSHYADVARKNDIATHLNSTMINSNGLVNFPKRTSSYANLYSKLNSSGVGSLEESSVYHQNTSTPGLEFVPSAYPTNQKPTTAMGNYLESGDKQSPDTLVNKIEPYLHSPVVYPLHTQYLRRSPNYVSSSVGGPIDSSLTKNQFGTSHGGFEGLPEAYLEALLSQQREQFELSLLGRSGGNCDSYGNLSFRAGNVPHPSNLRANSLLNSVGSETHLFHDERISQFNSMMRSPMGGSVGSWHTDNGNNPEGRFVSSLLDEFKNNNKTISFQLSDIVNHVVEFSIDQYGSRFIQQKLETAAVEEKAKIFPEIIPHARILTTDVFGNYVIQKFFEHGTESQRKELANQLTGHVLPLSLQMYGCRVIQKALEVVDVDQQTQMVTELDGSVIKCVRDQNGNHVIQKSIERIPQDRIQFIISSFYGQVVALSTHPYGCRVIQRVLEHCDDTNTQQIIMKEIMQSVCTLAQDQYGNYVIQHVLEHGKLEERTAIISKFTGQIVRMSQQKFASNVVEKCLTFASPEERQLLVNEILGSTDENEPLQAMMKDPFGNYVVQKVLETCNDQNLEFILSRIKVHLNALKRYTYGKHIVSRIEKLITTGERRKNLSSTSSLKLPN